MCKRVVHKHLGSVIVDVKNGETLRHTVTLTQGSVAVFSLIDSAHALLLTSNSAANPPATWVRDWPRTGDSATMTTTHSLLVTFAAAAKTYRWRIEHRDSGGAILGTPLDVEYSDDPTQSCQDLITVIV